MRHNYFDEKQGYYSVGDGGDDNDNQVKCRPLEEKGKTFLENAWWVFIDGY